MSDVERARALFFSALDLLDAKDFAGAEPLLLEALALVPDRVSALTNLAIARLRQNNLEGAEAVARRAVELDPQNLEGWLTLSAALSKRRDLDPALAAADRAIAIAPGGSRPLVARAAILNQLRRYDAAISTLVAALAMDPELTDARAMLVSSRMRACDWTHLEADTAILLEQIRSGSAFNPFILLAMPSTPNDQLACTRHHVSQTWPPKPALYRGERYEHSRIRVAYVSGDFREHPTSQLLVGVFEHHDRSQFETIGVSFAYDDGSAIRRRVERAFDRFIDMSGKTDKEIAQRLRAEEVDVAVDLGGHTDGGRPGVFVLRPAPVQVNYLVYPGTSGSPAIDYIFADEVVIPDDARKNYSESVVWLPGSYFAGDDKREISPAVPSRASEGLPESGFVFGSFSNSYKITPAIFDVWMRLVNGVPGSVLWLLGVNDLVPENLRREAEARGVMGERLVFARNVPAADHLARQRSADLLLDTPLYNAHTTASDPLWAGVPLLTLTGTTFAARVATSILKAMDLPDLITGTIVNYEETALRLARNPAALIELRAKVQARRDESLFFNTASKTAHLEAAYQIMVGRHRGGLRPDGFVVPLPATNP